ncbi:hypothetical protein GVW27_004414 [Salmonella enterica]|nr:hypothetical protein [Salmonella enterica]
MNKQESISINLSRKEAKKTSKSIFQADFPCEKCGSYDCYTNQKGRGCVRCKFLATEKRRLEQPEKVRAERREYNNRNRPIYNPEKFLFDGVKRARFLEAGTVTPEEFKSLENKCSFLKGVNLDYGTFTLDHAIPAAGVIINGVKVIGRTVAENLRVITVAENKAKSNKLDIENKEFKSSMFITDKDNNLTPVSFNTTTEELRDLFFKSYGINTKSPYKFEKKLDDGTITEKPEKRPSKSYYEVMRASVILELMMTGVKLNQLGREDYPLPDIWDDEKGKYVRPVIYVTRNLHSNEVIKALFIALRWVDAAKDALYWKERGLELSEDFNDEDIISRIENHFIDWVNNWSLDMTNSKMIYDFLKMPERQIKKDWVGCYLANKHLKSWCEIYQNDKENAYYADKVIGAWNIGKSAGATDEALRKLWILNDFPSVINCKSLVNSFIDPDLLF